MDCIQAAREDVLERYVAGSLSDEDRDAFEAHYFTCDRCFDDLQTLQAIRDELPRLSPDLAGPSRRWLPAWAPAAAVAATIVLAVGLTMWMRPAPVAIPDTTQAQLPSKPERSEIPPPRPSAPVAPGPSLEQLARFDPPGYTPQRLRSVPDEATSHFLRGMEHYGKADYVTALASLRLAAQADPDAAHIRFFLGISHLMLGQREAGIERLRATIALGDSPYLEEAHWYLAKAFLAQRDLGAAEAELNRLIQLRGQQSDEARRLLGQIQTLKERSD